MQDINGHSAFALSPGLAPETNGDSERQGLRTGSYSAPFRKASKSVCINESQHTVSSMLSCALASTRTICNVSAAPT